MLQQLQALEKLSRQLNPGADERAKLTAAVCTYAENYLQHIPHTPAYHHRPDNGRALTDSPIGEHGIDLTEALELLHHNVDTVGLNTTSNRFFGYIPGGGIYHAALGDYLTAVTNPYAGVFFAAPGAVRMENMLLRWLAEIMGYPESSGGNLASGGSIATLIAVVTARDAFGVEGDTLAKSVIYFTKHTHFALSKALRVAGLQKCVQRLVPVDDHFRMDAAALDRLIMADAAAGLRPWLVVASAGTTNTGSVDPLPAVADIAQAHGLWLHVDAAYGGFFALCEAGRRRLAGIERSDSLVMDPHKTLFLPWGTGAVLIRDRQKLYASFHDHADYMQDAIPDPAESSPSDYSPELTKHARGLRMWLPLKLLGVAPFRAALEEKMLLAQYAHQKLQEMAGFEVGPEPDLSILTFRYVPKRGNADEFNQRLVTELQRDGRIFLTSTKLNGRFVLRLAVGTYSTHLAEIEETLGILAQKAREIEAKS